MSKTHDVLFRTLADPTRRAIFERLCREGEKTVGANRTLSYTWNFVHDDAAYNLRSVVTFTLTPTSTGTHLRMEQSGFRPDQPRYYQGAKYGWQQFFANLEEALARID